MPRHAGQRRRAQRSGSPRHRPVTRPVEQADAASSALDTADAARVAPPPTATAGPASSHDTRLSSGARRLERSSSSAGSSSLSEQARAEYHYVARDLRNIGVLALVIGVMLAAAVFLFRALGIGTA